MLNEFGSAQGLKSHCKGPDPQPSQWADSGLARLGSDGGDRLPGFPAWPEPQSEAQPRWAGFSATTRRIQHPKIFTAPWQHSGSPHRAPLPQVVGKHAACRAEEQRSIDCSPQLRDGTPNAPTLSARNPRRPASAAPPLLRPDPSLPPAMAEDPPTKKKCLGVDCENDASSLQCPKCLSLGIKDSFFCSQDCFKKNWVRRDPTPPSIQHSSICCVLT